MTGRIAARLGQGIVVLWVIYTLLAVPTLFVFYDEAGRAPATHWTAFEHILNHGFKIAPVLWLFIWVAAGYMRRHTDRMDAAADRALAITF